MAKLLPLTGIGSLSHSSISEAIEYSMKFDIPFLPELIQLDGTMDVSNKNSCLELFLKKTDHLKMRKVQYPSPEINSAEIIDYNNCITFIDAPFIKNNEILKKVITGRALHSCCKINLDQVIELRPTHFSFDCHFIDEPEDFLRALIENKIIPIVGIISTHEDSFSRVESYKKWKDVLKNFATHCWLSPACGLAKFTPNQSEDIYQELLTIRSEILQSR